MDGGVIDGSSRTCQTACLRIQLAVWKFPARNSIYNFRSIQPQPPAEPTQGQDINCVKSSSYEPIQTGSNVDDLIIQLYFTSKLNAEHNQRVELEKQTTRREG